MRRAVMVFGMLGFFVGSLVLASMAEARVGGGGSSGSRGSRSYSAPRSPSAPASPTSPQRSLSQPGPQRPGGLFGGFGGMLGGLLLGLVETFGAGYLPILTHDVIGPEYKDIFAFIILIIVLIFGGLELWNRWQMRNHPEQQAYYRVAPWQRMVVGVVYIGLAAALGLGVSASHIEKDI